MLKKGIHKSNRMIAFFVGILLLVFCTPANCESTFEVDGTILLSLIARVETLEENDRVQKKQISTLIRNENNQKQEIAALKGTVAQMKERIRHFETKHDEMILANASVNSAGDENFNPSPRVFPGRSTYIRKAPDDEKARRFVENKVAFYATNSAHDIQHLGQSQALVFDVVHTNLGNGYNNVSGHFIAPVPGVYAFHVTICGRDVHTEIDKHYYAGIYVNNDVKSSFIVTPYDQSSQMLVSLLNAGDVVVTRNSRVDDGYIGQTFSSFSGFLLYETEGLPVLG
ncbi:cerebellin-3-like [Mya arenaria]|uniref:cerebellin-3-like n=1 Tax=Mya arenaria TaxID=6604 RepID=UPI0022E76826|nr:cerebellin-3-like [Mya arenaria]